MLMRGKKIEINEDDCMCPCPCPDDCPDECPEGCEMKNIAFLQYEYGTGSSNNQKSAVSNPTSICIDKKEDENPDLSIRKDVNRDTTEPGDVLTYTIYVANTGNMTLTGVTLTDVLDADSNYIAGTAEVVRAFSDEPITITSIDYEPYENTLTIEVEDELEVGESFIFSYDVQVSDPISGDDEITNNVMVDTNETEPEVDEITVPIQYATVSIEKTIVTPEDAECVRCGDDLTYQITVEHSGGTAVARDLVITDLFDSEFCFAERDVNVVPSGGSNVTVEDGLLTVTIAELDAGSTVTITIEGTVCCCNNSDQ